MSNILTETELIFANQAKTVKEKQQSYFLEAKVDKSYLDEWRSVRSLLNENYFKQMLEHEGMTLHEFSYALQPLEDDELIEDEWFNQFKNIVDEFDYDIVDFSDGINVLYLPFLVFMKKQMTNIINDLKHLTVSEKIINSFIEVTGSEMFNVFGKLVAIELEIFKQENHLEAESSEERFQEFLEKNYSSKEALMKFYAKYPVAARVATVRIHYLDVNFTNLLRRVDNDYEILEKDFQIENFALTELELSTGDSHQQGSSVAILVFDNQKVVYKPRNLEISESFEYFLHWCTENSNLLELKFPKGIYKKDYSYNEFISKENCNDNEEVERFYIRYGYLIAICYLLGINDLHMENIIATGEYPIIIDIETMFQPSFQFENESVLYKITKELELESVLNSCLLPKNLNIGVKKQVELSALNGKEVKTDTKIFSPKNINTDEFRFEEQEAYFKGGNNIPESNESKEVDFQEYRLKILEGFQDFMTLVMSRKQEFIQLLSAFEGKKVRVLMKGTERYAMMIRYADHPNYNSEMKYRERLMMNIWAYPYKDKRIVSSEVRDLLFNDIPIFFAYADSRDIIDSQNKVFENYFKTSGLQESIQRVQTLDKSKIEKQYKIMILSLGISDSYLNEKVGLNKLSTKMRKYNRIREAEAIARGIIKDMVTFEDGISFVTLAPDDEHHWKLEACNESLYGGLSGIALFFLNLYQKTHKKEYFTYYQKLLKTAINQTKGLPFKGSFDGWLSPIFPLLVEFKNFGTCADEKFLSFTIEKLNSLSRSQTKAIERTDYISGLAGILRLVEKINITFGDEKVSKQTIEIIATALRERIRQEDESVQDRGIAHGLSGIALSLLSSPLSEKETIKELLSKEMTLPIRKENEYKWCWGIPGMIQARIEILKAFQDDAIKEQLSILIEKFEKLMNKIPLDDSLCHGTGGILRTLEDLYMYSSDEKWKEKSIQIYSNIKENSLSRGYVIKCLLGSDIKGLFDGRTGVGSACLNELPNFMLLNLE